MTPMERASALVAELHAVNPTHPIYLPASSIERIASAISAAEREAEEREREACAKVLNLAASRTDRSAPYGEQEFLVLCDAASLIRSRTTSPQQPTPPADKCEECWGSGSVDMNTDMGWTSVTCPCCSGPGVEPPTSPQRKEGMK